MKTLSTMWGEVAIDPNRLPAPSAKAVEQYFVFFARLRLTFGDAAFNVAVVR